MRSTIRKRADLGFTLVEVLVALAIAAGAIVLILSANGASLRKSVRARLGERLQRAAESKFSEWKAGSERASEGVLSGLDGHRWEVRSQRKPLGGLRHLAEVRFVVNGPAGQALEWVELRETEAGP